MVSVVNSQGLGVEVLSGGGLLTVAIIYVCAAVAFYALRSIGLYCLAKRANCPKAALSFIPFVWVYVACKLIGNAQIFGRSFSKLAVIFCVIFSVAGYLQFIYDFLIYFPVVGNLLYGRPIYLIYEGITEDDLARYVPTLANGIYGAATGQLAFVNPYGDSLMTIYKILDVSSYFLSLLNIASIVISVSVYFNLFRRYWPQHYMLCGLLSVFDKVIASPKTAQCLEKEYKGKNGYREENPLHKPYVNICKLLTSYETVNPDKVVSHWNNIETLTEPLAQIGFFNFEELHFEVYEGKGGHLPGEIVLIDYAKHIAITGDIYINTHGLTKEQAEYNQYAPILMTSVDTDSKLCLKERQAIMERLGVGNWQIFGAHGFKKDYSVNL